MYGIYANIWGIFMVNVTIYIYIYHTWILWVLVPALIPSLDEIPMCCVCVGPAAYLMFDPGSR